MRLGWANDRTALSMWCELLKKGGMGYECFITRGFTRERRPELDNEQLCHVEFQPIPRGGIIAFPCKVSAEHCIECDTTESAAAKARSVEVQKLLTENSGIPDKPVKPTRRVDPIAAEFDQFAGQLMYEAHCKRSAEGIRSSKHRKTPDLPFEVFIEIPQRVDRELVNGSPKFPLRAVLTKKVWGGIASHNQRSGNTGKKIATLADAAKHPSFKSSIRQRFNRAEAFYREKIVQKQS